MRFAGEIGFVHREETRPGINTFRAEEHIAYGDVLSNVRRWQTGPEINNDLTLSNRISILADGFLCEHMGLIAYCRWHGTVWAVTSVELNYPRAILTLGGVYNGPVYEAPPKPEPPEVPEPGDSESPDEPDDNQGGE